MGGVTHAKDVVFKALKKGKHVITANKALLAQRLPEVRVRSSNKYCTIDGKNGTLFSWSWSIVVAIFWPEK